MKKFELDDFLQLQANIPDVVQYKADDAFRRIHQQANAGKTEAPDAAEFERTSRVPSRKKRFIFIAAAVLVMGSTVAAATHIRSKSLTEGLHASDEQIEILKENEMTVFVQQSVTDQDITVTAIQSITDNYYTHIAFRVEGYQVEPGVQPDFENVNITVDGENDFSSGSSFYNGLVSDDAGYAVNADGTPLEYDENGGIIENYVLDDGSLEYHITLANSRVKGYFYNKTIKVEMQNLGTLSKAEYAPDVEGTWSFSWDLQGKERVREYELSVPLGDTGAVVKKAEITPISLYVEYQFPRQEIMETAYDADGEVMDTTIPVEPPQLMGAKMKDGTLYPLLYLGPGSMGYLDENSDRYVMSFAIDRILDEEQVESLLFQKSYPEEGEVFTIDNFYEVPLSE